MQHLRDEQYYINLYDLLTIKECLRVIEFWHKSYKEHSNDKELKDLSKEDKLKEFNRYLNLNLFTTKGERYRRNQETIQEWMERDRTKQEKLDNAPEPRNVTCSYCDTHMRMTIKILEDYMNQPLRVLFYFECPTCKKRRGIYEDGEEHISKPRLCSKCNKEVKTTVKKKVEVVTWTYKCPACGFTEKEVDDYEKRHWGHEDEEKKDKELLAKYRDEFCLSDEKGKEYVETIEAMGVANEVYDEEIKKYDSSAQPYETVSKLNKLSIVELEKLITENLEKEKYIKLSLDKPEIGQNVVVPLTVQDSDSSRRPQESTNCLTKILKEKLESTNWRLEKNSVSYRLGYLSARLKGYEREEDLLEISGLKKDPKAELARSEKIQKYSGNNTVQLARLMGEMQGIENIRKKRLKKEPDGFFLRSDEGPYNCGICGERHYGNEIWWNLDGLRCADCRRNIKERVIPALKSRFGDKSDWFTNWQIKYDYGIHPSSIRRLLREGLLVGRDLKRSDESVYETIYLKSENQEFIKKFPKNPKMRVDMKIIDSKGNQVKL